MTEPCLHCALIAAIKAHPRGRDRGYVVAALATVVSDELAAAPPAERGELAELYESVALARAERIAAAAPAARLN